MITKTIIPTIEETVAYLPKDNDKYGIVKKVVVEYRIFGILLYRKTLITPEGLGFKYHSNFQTTF